MGDEGGGQRAVDEALDVQSLEPRVGQDLVHPVLTPQSLLRLLYEQPIQ